MVEDGRPSGRGTCAVDRPVIVVAAKHCNWQKLMSSLHHESGWKSTSTTLGRHGILVAAAVVVVGQCQSFSNNSVGNNWVHHMVTIRKLGVQMCTNTHFPRPILLTAIIMASLSSENEQHSVHEVRVSAWYWKQYQMTWRPTVLFNF